MRWKLCVTDGIQGYALYVRTKGDDYPRVDCNGWIAAKMDDGTPCMVNKEYVVVMYPDDEEGEE